jgi:hypothetical protein
MAKKLKVYNGSSWEDVTFAITPPSTNVTNAFTTNQVIDTSTSVAALRITQNGSGEAFRVEDSTNPDSSPFVITADGLLGIGTTDFSIRATTNLDAKIISRNGGILIENYNVDSGIIIARAGGTSSSPTQTLLNDRISYFIGSSYGSSTFNNNVAMSFFAAENITETARGSYIAFQTTPIGAVGRLERLRIASDGNVGIATPTATSRLHIYNTLATSVGSRSPIFESQVDNGNQDFLKLYQERTSAVSSWGGSDWVLRRHVDASPMGGFTWAAGDWNVRAIYGTPATPSVRTSHISTSAPTGGIDGDIWLVYTA